MTSTRSILCDVANVIVAITINLGTAIKKGVTLLYDVLTDGLIKILKVCFRTKNLKIINDKIIPAITGILAFIGVLGFFVAYGAIGTTDFYILELHEMVPADVEANSDKWTFIGMTVCVLCAVICLLLQKLIDFNEDIIRIRHERYLAYKAKKLEDFRWSIGDYLYENKVPVDKTSFFWNYTYGNPAKLRRLRKNQ